MMMNLFMIFDPMTSENYSLNWLSIFILFFFTPVNYWVIPSRFHYIYYKLMIFMINELKMILNIQIFNFIFFISLMYFLMLINFMGLFSYIFTCSSHLMFSLSISLSLWCSMMLHGWINSMEKMFIHLVPVGTPSMLMSFMVMIETISNLIRPLTLGVRLTANMIAGHLLMTLLGGVGEYLILELLIFMLLIQCMLMILEMSVSLIQSYVFVVLSSLYSNEFLYESN